METHIWIVLGCAVLSMVVGGIWYGPLFGKKWMEIIGVDASCMKEGDKMEMQKKMAPLYLLQFLLSFFQVYVLAKLLPVIVMSGLFGHSFVGAALLLWVALIMPTTAGACMWGSKSGPIAVSSFLIQTGSQVVMFVLFGLILGYPF